MDQQALKLSVQLLLEPISVMGLDCNSWVWVKIGYQKRFFSQVLDFWLQKEPKVGLGTKEIDFSPWILGFIFGYIKPSLDNVPISLVVE